MRADIILAGDLNRRVSIDPPLTEQNSSGEDEVSFLEEDSYQAWASIEPLTGRERLLSDQITANVDTRIRIRWTPRTKLINPTYRIRYMDTIYNIGSVVDVMTAHKVLEIMCSSGLNRG